MIIVKKPTDQEFQLFKPTGILTKFPIGTKYGLGCPGKNNYFVYNLLEKPNDVYTETTCNKPGTSSTSYFPNLQCKSIPAATLVPTNRSCAINGLIYEVGFIIENQFYGPILTICFDPVNNVIFYTNHIINGAAINGKLKIFKRNITISKYNFITFGFIFKIILSLVHVPTLVVD